MPPRLAFVRTPVWEQADSDVHQGFSELCAHLGDRVEEVELTPLFEGAVDWHRTIMETDLAVSFAREYERGRDRLSGTLREMIGRGLQHRAVDYKRAISRITELRTELGAIFSDFDAVLTPAVTGEAPPGTGSTGSPVFCTLWTLCGLPTLSLPLLQGSNGMPIGVQLVGELGDDARLLRTGRWLVESLAA